MDPEGEAEYRQRPAAAAAIQINQYTIDSEQKAAQKFDPGTIRLLNNTTGENRMR